ncbi:MAG TPA: hypothetical protein EYH30_02390 [Anaerolineales bacterium]|nr:hypothetical protein [Anaerolineae bacterium]HIQ00971.1 hypothetical protein [Anaerolineales bacterium]
MISQQPTTGNRRLATDDEKPRPPSPMEFGSMPLDPVYGWGLVFEPVETLISETAAYIEQLAREVYERGEEFSDQELEERFLSFWEGLVEEGKLRRLPDRPPEFGRAILGPRRWLRAQRIRIRRLVAYWQEQ